MHFYFAKILISAFLIVHIFLSKYFESILGTRSNLCSTPKVFIHAWDPFRRLLLFWVCRQERNSKVPFIYYLSTIWGFFDPFPLYVSIFYVLKKSNKDNFLTPPPPPFKCLRNIWMVPKTYSFYTFWTNLCQESISLLRWTSFEGTVYILGQ